MVEVLEWGFFGGSREESMEGGVVFWKYFLVYGLVDYFYVSFIVFYFIINLIS